MQKIFDAWIGRLLAITLSVIGFTATAGGVDEDPEEGQSWISEAVSTPFNGGSLIHGKMRATDDLGTTRDREFRIEVQGERGRDSRHVVLHRYEPECFHLAEVAKMTPDAFCDRLTIQERSGRVDLDFHSVDANRHYVITLIEDRNRAGHWFAEHSFGTAAPDLDLILDNANGDAVHQWSMTGARGRYTQRGEVGAAQLRELQLSPFEASAVALGDVLRAFNSTEFQYSDLPPRHPEFQPTPYDLWAEQPIEGGCIFIICFGDIGGGGDGGGGGGSNNSGDICDPRSDAYTPDRCPWDLTYATWPVSQRVKIWKINNDRIGYSLFLKNAGTGPFNSGSALIGNFNEPRIVFTSLIALGASQPLADPAMYFHPYGSDCLFSHNVGSLGGLVGSGGVSVTIQPGGSYPLTALVPCRKSSGRPPDRYRLWLRIDPEHAYDSVGYSGNNTGDSGLLDWVHLRH